jgi:hypothetical protein
LGTVKGQMIGEPERISSIPRKGQTMKTAIIAAIVAMLVSAASASAAFVVTSRNIKNGTIQLVDMSPRARAALRGQRGPQGPQGVPGISSISEVAVTLTFPPSGGGGAVATCPAGLAPISGGYLVAGTGIDVRVNRRSQQRGWEVGAVGPPGVSMLVYAYCAPGISGA